MVTRCSSRARPFRSRPIKSQLALAGPALLLAGCSATLPPRVDVTPHPAPLAALGNPDPTLGANKRLVFDLWREVVDAGREQRAARYVDPRFIEHHPGAGSGINAFRKYFSRRVDRQVEAWIKAPVVAMVAEGDLVALVTMQEQPHPARPGRTYTTTWFDMFRIENGRIAEHWDDAAPGEAAVESAW